MLFLVSVGGRWVCDCTDCLGDAVTYVEWGNEPLSLPLHYNFLFALCSDSVVIKKKRRRYFYVLVFWRALIYLCTQGHLFYLSGQKQVGQRRLLRWKEGRKEGSLDECTSIFLSLLFTLPLPLMMCVCESAWVGVFVFSSVSTCSGSSCVMIQAENGVCGWGKQQPGLDFCIARFL